MKFNFFLRSLRSRNCNCNCNCNCDCNCNCNSTFGGTVRIIGFVLLISRRLVGPGTTMAKRTIHVAAGRSHKRTIDAPTDKLALPIVERMTRSRLAKMTVEEEEEWKTESVNAILSLAPRKNDQASILKFLNTPAASEAGPSSRGSSRGRHTHEAPSPLKTVTTSPLKQYGPKKYSPTTPEGLSPSKRDGKIAAYMTWTPTPPRGKGKGKA